MKASKCVWGVLKKIIKYGTVTFLYTVVLAVILLFILFIYFKVLTSEGRLSASIMMDCAIIENPTLECDFGKDLTLSTDSTPFVVALLSDSFEVDGVDYTQQSKGAHSYSIMSDDTYYNPSSDSVNEGMNGEFVEEAPDIDLEMRKLFYTIHISSNSNISAEFKSGLYGVEMLRENRMKVAPTNRSFILIKSDNPINITFEEHKMMLTDHKDIFATQVNTLIYPAKTDLLIYTNGTSQEKLGEIETMEGKSFYNLKYDMLNSFQFESANSIKSTGTGKAYYFTSANPKVFDLEHQEINVPLIQDGSGVNVISGQFESGRLVFQGQIESAEIMDYSIQPSIWGWMNESTNLVPSIILTLLGGAISLTIVTLKVEKKEEKEGIEK